VINNLNVVWEEIVHGILIIEAVDFVIMTDFAPLAYLSLPLMYENSQG